MVLLFYMAYFFNFNILLVLFDVVLYVKYSLNVGTGRPKHLLLLVSNVNTSLFSNSMSISYIFMKLGVVNPCEIFEYKIYVSFLLKVKVKVISR